jgi:ferredoxin/flavodoxin
MRVIIGPSVKLVFFSGTGGTARVAKSIERAFENKGVEVQVVSLDLQASKTEKIVVEDLEKDTDLLVLMFPVHAFDAPEPIYEWIRKISSNKGVKAAVISVSGGGEVWPNTACRVGSINELKRKGYDVFYERMIVMPSNWIVATKECLAIRLMQVLPIKAEHCVSELLSTVHRRTKPQVTARIMTTLFKLEKPGAKLFGKDIKVKKSCTGCGWCSKNCPRGNIKLIKGRPSFGWKCILCLRCVYGCPKSAIQSRVLRFIKIKGGYDLNELEKRSISMKLEPFDIQETRGMFLGLRDYLLYEET